MSLPNLQPPALVAWRLICERLTVPSEPLDEDVEAVDRQTAATLAQVLRGKSFDRFIDDFERDETWASGMFRANQLGIRERQQIAVIALAGEWRASGSFDRPYGRALLLATADLFNLAIPADVSGGALGDEARRLVASHHDFWRHLLATQYDSTQQLLGATIVEAHRGVQRSEPARAGVVDPELRPLSSFSLDRAVAAHFPLAGSGQYTFMQHARVPAERILATPATGFASLQEREIVVIGPAADQTDEVLEAA